MDVEQKINNVISLAIKTQNYKIIVERLTFNERYSVLRMGYQDIVKYSVYPYLFTKEESEMLFEEVDNPLIKSIFLLNMSDEQKLDYVFNFDFKRVPDVIYLKSFTNIKLRTEAVLYIAENRDNDFDKHWEFYFELLDDDKKIELLSYMLLSKPINNKIGTTGKGRISLISIIKTFKQESMLKVIELFEQYKMFYIYDADCLDVILNVLDDSLKLKVLEKYLVFVSQNLNKFIFNQYNFISKFNADKKFEALELFIKYNTFNKYIMIGFFDKISPSEVCSYIEFIMKCSDQYGMNLIDESFFAEMINYYSFDVYKEILNKFVINSNVIDMVKVIKEIKELGNKLNVLDYLFSLDLKLDFELFFNYLKTLDFNGIDYDSNKYRCLVDVFVKKYSLDKKGLDILFNRFGYTVFKFLDNKNMQETACLSVEQLEKYIKLFDQKYVEINEGIINSVCNSFLQREFRLVQKDDYSIFSMFEQLLSKKNEDTYFCILDMLNHIRECVTLEKYLDDMGLDQFINKLISGNSESLDILHSITQEYIMRKREDYVKSRLKGIVNELNLDKKVEKDYFKKKFLNINSVSYIYYRFKQLDNENLSDDEIKLINDEDLLKRLISFKKGKATLSAVEKKKLRLVESLLSKIYIYEYSELNIIDKDTIYDYSAKQVDNEFLLGIISQSNPLQIVDKLLNNNELYEQLCVFLEKYKILGWGDTFSNLQNTADITFNEWTLSSLICYFYKLFPLIEKCNITEFIDNINCYSSISDRYSLLFGKEDFRYLAANSGKNKSSMLKQERIDKACHYIIDMYSRLYLTIPTLDEVITLENKKRISVLIGNFTNMMNLTLGERTDSCMRIGGSFCDLFDFCIKNDNGFHACFFEEETGKLISRVSGVRNGNTIFFNELRSSVIPYYTDEDLVEVLKMVSGMLIEKSSSNEFPIENVVVSYDFAMKDYENSAIPINLINKPDAIYNLNFNISLNGKAVVLKTTNKDNSLVEYKLSEERLPKYPTLRKKVRVCNSYKESIDGIFQLKLIDSIMNGDRLDSIKLDMVDDIQCCYLGEDWYVYVDKNGLIHQEIIGNTRRRNEALEEIKCVLEEIKKHDFNKVKGMI